MTRRITKFTSILPGSPYLGNQIDWEGLLTKYNAKYKKRHSSVKQFLLKEGEKFTIEQLSSRLGINAYSVRKKRNKLEIGKKFRTGLFKKEKILLLEKEGRLSEMTFREIIKEVDISKTGLYSIIRDNNLKYKKMRNPRNERKGKKEIFEEIVSTVVLPVIPEVLEEKKAVKKEPQKFDELLRCG